MREWVKCVFFADGGEALGACGNGLNDCLADLYPPAALFSYPEIPLAEGPMAAVSLMPRL